MSLAAHLYKKLLDTSSIFNIVGSRIFPLTMPQGESFPCLIYQEQTRESNDTKSGASTFDKVAIQIDVYASTYKSAKALAEHVRTALDRYSGTLEGTTFDQVVFVDESDEGLQEEHRVFRVLQSYQIRLQR